jgi:hypothetical protein
LLRATLKTPEVRILIDAVNAAPFLTEEMTCNLTEKAAEYGRPARLRSFAETDLL